MEKKLIGLSIFIIFAAVAISGCIGEDDNSVNISEDNQTNNDSNQTKDTSSGKDSSSKKDKKKDPIPNEEPEPPAEEKLT